MKTRTTDLSACLPGNPTGYGGISPAPPRPVLLVGPLSAEQPQRHVVPHDRRGAAASAREEDRLVEEAGGPVQLHLLEGRRCLEVVDEPLHRALQHAELRVVVELARDVAERVAVVGRARVGVELRRGRAGGDEEGGAAMRRVGRQ